MKTLAALIIGLTLISFSTKLEAQVGVQITVAPPLIPVYEQPPCPNDGWMWTPGYWAYGPDGYYWVPGVWVASPEVGFLWTPGYWGFEGGYYLWHRGYWGPHVGFYGGINYGWGYGGRGFYGGRWEGGAFRYNTTVWHVNNQVIHNTYSERPAEGPGASRAAFNGQGGVSAAPSPAERSAMAEHHVDPTSAQQSHEQAMSKDKNQLASVNKGKPATTAMSSVNGQRFNNGGHAVSNTPVKHTATTNHTSGTNTHQHTATHQSQPQQHASSHPAAVQQHQAAPHEQSAARAQQRSAAPQAHPQQHTSAPQQHMNAPRQQHMSSPHPAAPQHQEGGGGGRR
ncbi:MAG TPA: hypothetical protein VK783_09050 [Bacteroidia bacterium]|nr:hypothetical protein [Bacteroidia bacterium]